jgi:ADP-ribose pyrophosphatase
VKVSSKRVFDGKLVKVDVDEVVEPGDVHATREIIRHNGSIAALPVNDDGTVILVRQYRYAANQALWELPAGKLDGNESPEDGIQRELREEIGKRAGRLEKIAFFYTTPGFCDEVMHLYRATGLVDDKADADEDERIEIGVFTLAEVEAMVATGALREAKTLIAVLLEVDRRRRRVSP